MKPSFTFFLAGLLFCGCSHKPAPLTPVAMTPSATNQIAQISQRVAELERQVQELSQVVEPLKAEQAIDRRRRALRVKFNNKIAQDLKKYSREQIRDAEQLYQVANRKWGSPEASASLQKMITEYPDINRTGCAVLYMAQMSQGEERAKYLQECMKQYNNCWYGDGVQVGAYARYLLIQDYLKAGEQGKAEALTKELEAHYPDAIDHTGHLLRDRLDPAKS